MSLIAGTGALLFLGSLLWFLYCYTVRFRPVAPAGPILTPTLFDLALFSVFALHHSLLARTVAKLAIRRLVPADLERSLYTWVASALFIAVCTLWQPVPGLLYQLDGPWAVAGYCIQVAGFVLTFLGASTIGVLDLAGVRSALDANRGSPEHVRLETSGVYGFVRHPLYFAWVLFVFGAPTMTATRATFAIASTLYLALAIPFEERSLVEVFGAQYEEYRRKVRWRMMPGIY